MPARQAKKATKRAAKKAPARKRARGAAAPLAIPSPDEVLGEVGASLNDQQRAFAYAWAADPRYGKITEAYLRVYPGVQRNSAAANGHRLLQMPAVRELVAAIRAPILAHYAVSAERTIEELAYAAYLDPADLYDEAGKLLPVHKMPPHARRAIAGVKYGKDGLEIKLVSKERACELLGKKDKLFTDVVKVEGLDEIAAELAAARRRAKSR